MNWSSLFEFSPAEWTAIRLSLKVAIWAVGTSLPFGVCIALVLARRRFWGREVLDVCVHLPLILPPVVTGYFLLLLFGRTWTAGPAALGNVRLHFCFPLDRGGARLGGGGLSADGASHTALDRSCRPEA